MLKKRILFLCLSLILLVCSCKNKEEAELVVQKSTPLKSQAMQESTIVEDAEKKPLITLNAEDTVEILVRQDGAPGMYLGDDGELHGFYVDLEKMVMKEMGQKYRLIPYSDVGPAAQGIKSGIYHIALAVPDVPDYRSFVNLSVPFEVLDYVVFVHEGKNDIAGQNKEEILKNLYGKKVGVQTRGHIYQNLRDIREINLIEYPTTTKALEDLNNGKLDAVPDVKRIGIYYARKNDWDIVPVGVPIITQRVSTGFSKMVDTSLVDRYNKALTSLIDDGRFDALYESYFGPIVDAMRPKAPK